MFCDYPAGGGIWLGVWWWQWWCSPSWLPPSPPTPTSPYTHTRYHCHHSLEPLTKWSNQLTASVQLSLVDYEEFSCAAGDSSCAAQLCPAGRWWDGETRQCALPAGWSCCTQPVTNILYCLPGLECRERMDGSIYTPSIKAANISTEAGNMRDIAKLCSPKSDL